MVHAQAEHLNKAGRCRNPTAGIAPWFAWKQNANVATKVVRRNLKKNLTARFNLKLVSRKLGLGASDRSFLAF